MTVPQNISYTAEQAGLSAVAGALTEANLVTALDSAMDVTVFAPNNAAFQSIGSALGNLTMMELANILEYHGKHVLGFLRNVLLTCNLLVVNGTVAYSSTLKNETVMAMNGVNLTITVEGSDVFVNSAKVVTPNVLVANGVVHVIDKYVSPA